MTDDTQKVTQARATTSIECAASRRAVLGLVAMAPITTLPLAARATSNARREAVPVYPALRRSRSGRGLSRIRYHNAEGFLAGPWDESNADPGATFYRIGIVIHLGLTAHLLDVGFEDEWNARHLGLHLARALDLANATGLDCRVPAMMRIAESLSPYGKWRNPSLSGERPVCAFSFAEARTLARMLLDRVREATGHPRPRRR